MGKSSNGKLRISTLVNDVTLRSTAEFASAFSNVNNIKMSDMLEFFVKLLYSFLCYYPKKFAESCKIMKT